MSRRMEYSVAFDAPAEKIYQDFTSRQYWQTLMDAYCTVSPQSEITKFASTERGTDIVFVQNLPRKHLPPVARNVVPVDVIITRRQHFEPFDHTNGRARGTYSASTPGVPGSFGGRSLLTETETGSALRISSMCKVWLPFVGGAIEELIIHHIAALFDAEEAFTADWIAKHH